MARRLADIIRNVVGAPVSGAAVTVKKVIDNSTVASTTTGADGKAEWSETEIDYPGDIYYTATDGDTTRVHAGYSTGQIGTWWASDFPRAMRVMTDGVRKNIDGELNVTANGTNRDLTIANGLAFLYGHTYYQPGNKTVTVAANGAGNPRIDLVVIRLYPPGTATQGKIEAAIVQGTPAASPSAPTPTQDVATVWEIPLKSVLVDPGVSAIVSGKLTDARQWTSGPLMDAAVTTVKLADNNVTPAKLTTVTDFSTAAAAKVLKASVSPTVTPVYGTLNLAELNDVDETTPTDGQVVTWDAASSKYKPKAPPSVQVIVQEGDVTVDAAVNTLDFAAAKFDVTSSPAGEANITLATDSITATEIAAGAVGSSELAAGAVIAGKLGAASVGNTELSNGSVDSAKLAVDSVLTTRIANAQVTGAKIANTTITAANIAADTITANEIAANAITSSELANFAVVAGKIATNGLSNSLQITDGIVTFAKIAAAAIGTGANKLAASDHTHLLPGFGADSALAGYTFHSVGTSYTTICNFNSAVLVSGVDYDCWCFVLLQGNAPSGGNLTSAARITAGGAMVNGMVTGVVSGERPIMAFAKAVVTGTGAAINFAARAITDTGTGSVTDGIVIGLWLPRNVLAS